MHFELENTVQGETCAKFAASWLRNQTGKSRAQRQQEDKGLRHISVPEPGQDFNHHRV